MESNGQIHAGPYFERADVAQDGEVRSGVSFVVVAVIGRVWGRTGGVK